jgi:membrane protein DedA with SNARE-associated domain
MNLTEFFLSAMTTAGPLALALALFLGPVGLPIPTGLLVLAAGALARQGLMPWATALTLGLAATVLGDLTTYGLGRLGSGGVARLTQRRAELWQRAQGWFHRRGGLAVYTTRVLLTSLDVPTTLIAGGSGYAFRRFLAWDLAGRATWLLLYGGLGYLAGSQWPVVSQLISTYGIWLGSAAASAGAIACLHRRLRRNRQPPLAACAGWIARFRPLLAGSGESEGLASLPY